MEIIVLVMKFFIKPTKSPYWISSKKSPHSTLIVCDLYLKKNKIINLRLLLKE